MNRDQIVEAFRHHESGADAVDLHRRIAETMTAAVVDVAGSLPDCDERDAFIDLCRRAQWAANAAASRVRLIEPADPAGAAVGPRRQAETGTGEAPGAGVPAAPELSVRDDGVVRLGLAGAFHRATEERPDFETRLDTPPGTYRRIVFRFRVHHGGWNRIPSRNQNLFWFARDRHVDLFGFGVARGPGGPPQVFYRSDWGVNHTNKQRVVERFLMQAGETYDVRFDFDAAGGRIVLALADSSGAEVMRAIGKPNIDRIPFKPGQKVAVGFGFRGDYDNEPAQPGWVWSDLVVELEPAEG